MSRTIRRLAFVASLLVAPALVAVVAPESAAHAQTATTASEFLKDKQAKLLKLLRENKPSAERTTKLNAELANLIDYEEMAKGSLGTDEWGKHSEAERTQFTGLLKQLIVKSYTKRLDDLVDYDVAYKSESASGSDTTVKTEAKSQKDKRAAAVQVDYVLRKKGSGYVIVDIVPEQSSYVKTYNKEFTKVLKRTGSDGGWDALIAKLNKKLAEK